MPIFDMEFRPGYGISVDIGTTTVALDLVDLRNGKVLGYKSEINPQKSYGLDLLTRISYELGNGEVAIKELQNL